MKIKLPKSKTVKLDLLVIFIVALIAYTHVDKLIEWILGDKANLPADQFSLLFWVALVISLIVGAAIVICAPVFIVRFIASKVFGIKTGDEYIEIDTSNEKT